jgi:ubiquitin thioesterase CYLD
MCGRNVSTFECKDCYHSKALPGILSFCKECNGKIHSHPDRLSHKYKPIAVPREYSQYANEQKKLPIEMQTMDLFAVVCIATSHYVAFVKCGTSDDSPWCFFDSMADRKGKVHL